MDFEIKQLRAGETAIVETILTEAVKWLDDEGIHQWEYEDVTWDAISELFSADDFFITYADGKPAACMALIDYDPVFWEDVEKGESLYIHKLAVRREFAGMGIAKLCIDFAKSRARSVGASSVRLDCYKNRTKVRALYEREGFKFVREQVLFGHYDASFYVCEL